MGRMLPIKVGRSPLLPSTKPARKAPYAGDSPSTPETAAAPKQKAKAPKGVRLLSLEDFPAISIGALWRGQQSPLAQRIVSLLKHRAGDL